MAQLTPHDKLGIPLAKGDTVFYPSNKDGVSLKQGKIKDFKFDNSFKVEIVEFLVDSKDPNQDKYSNGETYFLNDCDLINISEILLACPEFD